MTEMGVVLVLKRLRDLKKDLNIHNDTVLWWKPSLGQQHKVFVCRDRSIRKTSQQNTPREPWNLEGEFCLADQSTEEGGASLLPREHAEHAVIKRGTIFAWSHILCFYAKTYGGLSRMSHCICCPFGGWTGHTGGRWHLLNLQWHVFILRRKEKSLTAGPTRMALDQAEHCATPE